MHMTIEELKVLVWDELDNRVSITQQDVDEPVDTAGYLERILQLSQFCKGVYEITWTSGAENLEQDNLNTLLCLMADFNKLIQRYTGKVIEQIKEVS